MISYNSKLPYLFPFFPIKTRKFTYLSVYRRRMSYKTVILEISCAKSPTMNPAGRIPPSTLTKENVVYPEHLNFTVAPKMQGNSNTYITMHLNLRQNLFICTHSAIEVVKQLHITRKNKLHVEKEV